jgi:hypothetical protein
MAQTIGFIGSGAIASALAQAKDFIAKAVRKFPVGDFPEDLPPVLLAISRKHGRLPK